MAKKQSKDKDRDYLQVIGAKENNLKDLSITLPKNKLVVITGVSGSGKSSLAFDTIFAEGQRRYVESLSTYARQFLGQIDKPNVEMINGLSPAIAIDQKSTHNNPRSTVGTVTEIYDYLRLLFGRIGHQHCPTCGEPVSKQTIDQIIDSVYAKADEKRAILIAPLVQNKKGDHSKLIDNLKKDGFLRIRVNNEDFTLEDNIEFKVNKKYTIDLVVDRISIKKDNRTRLTDSLTLALRKGNGFAKFEILGDKREVIDSVLFSEDLACPHGHGSLPELSPKLFSFNSPQGACPECHGLGSHATFTEEKIIPDPTKPLVHAIEPWAKSSTSYYFQLLSSIAKAYNVNPMTPWNQLTEEFRDAVLYGTKEPINLAYDSYDGTELINIEAEFEGVVTKLQKKYQTTDKEKIKANLKEYMSELVCKSCNGGRLSKESLAVTVADKNIHTINEMTIEEAHDFFADLEFQLSYDELKIVERVLPEIKSRLKFLKDVGLDYLTLGRSAGTLSGGEAQRIRLATQIGSGLSGILYVLDEPSIGLHQRDNDRLISTLKHLRELGNTVIVVEHDEDTMREADWIVDIGEGAGKYGGSLIAEGDIKAIEKNKESLTGKYLRGELAIETPSEYRPGNGLSLEIQGANLNNLKDVNVTIPLGKVVAVTGVSGSGKSSLIMELLLPYLESCLKKNAIVPKCVESVEGTKNIDKVIEIDQSPIGRTPHSNPATYTGAFTPIRELFASMNEAKLRGYGPGHFSFNVKGAGRCEHCQGQGQLEIEMHFLPSVYLECPVCKGKRYTQEILEVKFRDYNISDVLQMTVSEAVEVFSSIPSIYNKLVTLEEVGLGYISLGQSAVTLSGGEAQRVKLATELSKRQTGKTLYILDEPTTGLHWHDIAKLLKVLNKLADAGNSILVIEHNLDIIKQADWIIDLGPEGGVRGGQIIAEGTPKDLIRKRKSHTGKYLKKLLDRQKV